MTQTAATETIKSIDYLTAEACRTAGAARDNIAHALCDRGIPLDMVCWLVAASARHRAALTALTAAEESMKKAASTAYGAEAHAGHGAVKAVFEAAAAYAAAVNRDGVSGDVLDTAHDAFTAITSDLTATMTDQDGRDAVRSLAWSSMAVAMAGEAERDAAGSARYARWAINRHVA